MPPGGLAAAELAPLQDRDAGQDRQRVEAHGLLLVADPALGELEQQGATRSEREACQGGQDQHHRQRQPAGLLGDIRRLRDADRGVAVYPDLLERVDALGDGGQRLGVGAELSLEGVQAIQRGTGLLGEHLAPCIDRGGGEGVGEQGRFLGRVGLGGDGKDVALALGRDLDRVEDLVAGPVSPELVGGALGGRGGMNLVAGGLDRPGGIARVAQHGQAEEGLVVLGHGGHEHLRGGRVGGRAQALHAMAAATAASVTRITSRR